MKKREKRKGTPKKAKENKINKTEKKRAKKDQRRRIGPQPTAVRSERVLIALAISEIYRM
jgi:hypothetical protein